MKIKNFILKLYFVLMVAAWAALIIFIMQSVVSKAFGAPPSLLEIAATDISKVEIETNTITQIGSTRRFKLHTTFRITPSSDFIDDEQNVHKFTEPVLKMVDTIEMNCMFESFITTKKQFFNKNLKTLHVYQPEDPKVESVIPETVAGVIFPLLCNKNPSPKYDI